MIFTAKSSNLLNVAPLTASPLQASTALSLSTGSSSLADPIQLSGNRLGASSSSLATTTELTPVSTSLISSDNALVKVSDTISVSEILGTTPAKKSGTVKDRIELKDQYDYDYYLKYILNPALDNTLAGAYDLRKLDGKTLTRSDSIGNGDNIDYTHFHLDQASAFNLLLKGATGNAAVDLLNASGSTIASSYDGRSIASLLGAISTTQNFDTHDVALNLSSLAAGDYYLKVSPVWTQQRSSSKISDRFYLPIASTTDYDLTVSTSLVSNLLPTEVDLGNLAGTRLLTGSLNSNNTSEMYRVTLGAGTLHITLSGMNANADVRLIKDSNNDGIINGNEAFASSSQWYGFTDGIYNAVRGGTYFIQVSQGQGAFGATTNYNLGVSTGDWYTNNLNDFGVIAQARLAGADSWIDRNEMLSIMRETKDFGTIDVTELADLRTVLSGLGHAMPDSVRNLANKVLNSDPANTRSGGSSIGNMYSGDSSDKLERLIGKWFLGNENARPTAHMSTTYQRASGSLFVNGISWQDIDQGTVGDCYFMAGLAAVARTDRTIIDSMITDNGDDTFTVRFYNNGTADYVTVDRFLPTKDNGFFYANNSSGKRFDNSNNELWDALIEKAYAQVNESGWLGRDNTNSYAGINNGLSAPVLSQITGRGSEGNRHVSSGASFWEKDDIGYIINAFNANKPVVFGHSNDDDSRIVPNHEYTLIDYNAGTGIFTLFNPWGINGGKMPVDMGGQFKPGIVSLSKDEVINSFDFWFTTA